MEKRIISYSLIIVCNILQELRLCYARLGCCGKCEVIKYWNSSLIFLPKSYDHL